jgi:tetratricopeptide (TPR) repeat protein
MTKEFVPNDYYQYEHLAQIQWQRMSLAGSFDTNGLKKGKDYATEALRLRPQASRAKFLMARFNEKAWDNAKANKTTDAESAAEALRYFKQALTLRPDITEYKTAYRDFLLKVADPATTDPKVALEMGSALLDAAKNEFVGSAADKQKLLTQAVTMLMRAVALSEAKDTDEKRQINEQATKLHTEATQLLSGS